MIRIGEIVETMSTGLVAESFQLNRPPALGSLVVIESEDARLYAVVTYGRTAGLDPSRHAVRQGSAAVSDAAIYREHPELEHTLRTEFGAALVGLAADGAIKQHLPAQPPPLHYSVQTVPADEVRRFTDQLQYLRLLLQTTGAAPSGEVPALQVLAANLREVFHQRGEDRDWLERAAKEIATLLKDDHQALLTVLYAIDPGEQAGGARP